MCRPPAMGSNESLEQAYREISRAGVGALELRDWPRSSHFLEHCTETEGGALLPRRFKTNPGVGVFRASSSPLLHPLLLGSVSDRSHLSTTLSTLSTLPPTPARRAAAPPA